MCAEKFHTCGGPRRRPGLGEGRGRRMYHVCTILYIYTDTYCIYYNLYPESREREREWEWERERYIYRDTYTQTQTYIIYIPTFGPLDWPSTIFFWTAERSRARQFPDAALVLACGDLGTKTALVALLGVFTYCTAINWGFIGDLMGI